MMARWPLAVFTALVVISLAAIGLLGRTIATDLRALSVAQNDDVSWRMSQLEVELLRFQNAVQAAESAPEADLANVRKRFDIFYSRIATLRESRLDQFLSQDPMAQGNMDAANLFLDQTTPLIDGADTELRTVLPRIYDDLGALAPDVRALALAGVRIFTSQEEARRDALSDALKRVAFGIAALILALCAVVLGLVKLFRQGQKASLRSEADRARFEAAVSSSLDAVLVVDARGRILEFNGAAETVFGYTRQEAVGADMAELIVPEHMRQAHRNGMQRFLQTGEKKVIGAGRVRLEGMRKSGEIFPVELSISMSEASRKTIFVSFLRDITSELQAEEDLKAALEKAQESEKAKSNLLTVMSHEMRTPLNGILGSLELFETANLNKDQKRHLTSIGISGELLLSHVNDVLDLSSLASDANTLDHTAFDLTELVQGVSDSLRANAATAGTSLNVNVIGAGLGRVEGSRIVLQRCLTNLVGNAIKFTQDGEVTVEMERLANGDLVEIRVSDTGVGIAPENLERIFEEFVTIDTAFDRENSGTGLGLAITKRLVEQHEGRIEADSILGEGSLFTVTLPLPEEVRAAPETGGDKAPALPDLPQGFEALVVDDNDINREILSDIVEGLGGVVHQASNGLDAVDVAQTKPLDILLLDISMPGIDGIETLRRIRQSQGPNASTPALAVTAHASPKDHEHILGADFADVLLKPVRRVEIHRQLVDVFFGPIAPAEASAPVSESDEPDFLKRFGAQRYQAAMAETQQDVSRLLTKLRTSDDLGKEDREEAHRLSGSAAVLGHTELWAALQAIQNVPEGDWPSAGSGLVSDTDALLNADQLADQ